ncbi:MAG: hypothetical protein LBH00_13240 [Planctomycetaceae bacterium]|jgi:hypothetical protein|nr:hypothetical protein [Planctomycetaceae bacterium]
MSIDFPKIPESVSPLPLSKSAAESSVLPAQSIQQAFSAALRSRYAGQSSTGSESPASALLDIIAAKPQREQEPPHREKQIAENRQQLKQQQAEQTYQTQIDRKLQNQSETRKHDKEAGYERQIERPHRLEHKNGAGGTDSGQMQTAANPGKTVQIPLLNDIPIPGILTKKHVPPPQTVSLPVMPQPGSPNLSGGTSGTAVNLSVSLPGSVPSVSAAAFSMPSAADHRIFSLFTLSGKWGPSVENKETESDDSEDEQEETENLQSIKKHPFADLTAIFTENTRPIRRLFSPDSPPKPPEERKNSELQPEPAPTPNRVPSPVPNTVAWESLSVSAGQNPSAAKNDTKTQETDRQQYLQRIAAACEHAVRNAPVRMKINLDHLGTLSLRFFTKAKRLEMAFDPENEAAADFLRQNLKELQAVLAEQEVAAKIVIEELSLTNAF